MKIVLAKTLAQRQAVFWQCCLVEQLILTFFFFNFVGPFANKAVFILGVERFWNHFQMLCLRCFAPFRDIRLKVFFVWNLLNFVLLLILCSGSLNAKFTDSRMFRLNFSLTLHATKSFYNIFKYTITFLDNLIKFTDLDLYAVKEKPW